MSHTPSEPDASRPAPPRPGQVLRSAPEATRKALSAAMDGELSAQETRFLLRALGHDAALQAVWSRFELGRDCLRHELDAPCASAGFAARVSAAVQGQSMPPVARRRHWLRWSAGGAIAASVAAATLMIGQPSGDLEQVATRESAAGTSALVGSDASRSWAAPSAVPPWLSGNAAGLLSQRASATTPWPLRQAGETAATLPSLYRYRTQDNADGSYLLLLDPAQATSAGAVPQRVAVGAR